MQISRGQTNPVAVFFLLLPSSTLFYGDEGVVFNARGNLNFNAFFQKVPFGGEVIKHAIDAINAIDAIDAILK